LPGGSAGNCNHPGWLNVPHAAVSCCSLVALWTGVFGNDACVLDAAVCTMPSRAAGPPLLLGIGERLLSWYVHTTACLSACCQVHCRSCHAWLCCCSCCACFYSTLRPSYVQMDTSHLFASCIHKSAGSVHTGTRVTGAGVELETWASVTACNAPSSMQRLTGSQRTGLHCDIHPPHNTIFTYCLDSCALRVQRALLVVHKIDVGPRAAGSRGAWDFLIA
jgi:hypothetical protein